MVQQVADFEMVPERGLDVQQRLQRLVVGFQFPFMNAGFPSTTLSTFWAKRGIDRTLRLSDAVRCHTTSKRHQICFVPNPTRDRLNIPLSRGDTVSCHLGQVASARHLA
jgi:hypothetical protein